MSFASASARARFRSTRTISRPTPFMTSAKADAEPTIPQPTMPIFMTSPSRTPQASQSCEPAWRASLRRAPLGTQAEPARGRGRDREQESAAQGQADQYPQREERASDETSVPRV